MNSDLKNINISPEACPLTILGLEVLPGRLPQFWPSSRRGAKEGDFERWSSRLNAGEVGYTSRRSK